MQRQFPRWVIRHGARVGVALTCLAGCSLQDFDALGNGTGELGAGGTANTSGAGGSGGAALGGSAGTSTAGSGGSVAGSSGSSGTAGTSTTAGSGGTYTGTGGSSAGTGNEPEGDAGTPQNLFPAPGFENGHLGWVGFGDSGIVDAPGEGREGSDCISSINRAYTYEGPSCVLDAIVQSARSYLVEAWVRSEAGIEPVSLSLKTVCTGTADLYTTVAVGSADATEWSRLSGTFTAPNTETCALTELRIYLEGPPTGVSFYVDDAALYLIE